MHAKAPAAWGKLLKMGNKEAPQETREAIETASRGALAALQLERLGWSLAHACRNVAPVRRKFERAGAHPDDLKSLPDLAKFPFTTKQDLREAYPFGLFAVPREKIVRLHASSGTTGKPTVVGYTQADLDMWANVMARSIFAAGRRPGEAAGLAAERDARDERAGRMGERGHRNLHRGRAGARRHVP